MPEGTMRMPRLELAEFEPQAAERRREETSCSRLLRNSARPMPTFTSPTKRGDSQKTGYLKVLFSEIDPVEIRLIR
jgi:hypothetical protein